jgi:hypothetical protein
MSEQDKMDWMHFSFGREVERLKVPPYQEYLEEWKLLLIILTRRARQLNAL